MELSSLGGIEFSQILAYTNLGEDQRSAIVNALDFMLGATEIVKDFNQHLLPNEFRLLFSEGREKTIEIDWGFIFNDKGVLDKILVLFSLNFLFNY